MRLALLFEAFHVSPQSLQANNTEILLEMGHDRFLPGYFQLIIYLSSHHSPLHNVNYGQWCYINILHKRSQVIAIRSIKKDTDPRSMLFTVT
jgi:hypothetical protein